MLTDDNSVSCFTDDNGVTSWTDDNGLLLTCGAAPPAADNSSVTCLGVVTSEW